MTTTITYNGKQFIEQDNNNVQLTNAKCKCSNELINIPLAIVVLGIVEDCGHCCKEYPQENHCKVLTESYISLIFNESEVEF